MHGEWVWWVVLVAISGGCAADGDGQTAVEGSAEFCNPLDRDACDDEPSCLGIRGRIVVDGCPTEDARFVGCIAPAACEGVAAEVCDVGGIDVLVGPDVCDLPPEVAQMCGPAPSANACE